MLDSDKKEFASILGATLKTYRIEPDADVLRLWWGVLKRFSIEQVRNGFNAYIGSKDAKFIVPANIVEAIEKNEPDGRLGVEEAWAMFPHDEASSAVITNEMAEAMQPAQELLIYGDRIGARMAFKEAYIRIVERNKLNGVAPRWFASLGHDREGREVALNEAVRLGRLSADHAQSLLPVKQNQSFESGVMQIQSQLKIASNEKLSDEDRQKAKEKMAKIKALLGGAA